MKQYSIRNWGAVFENNRSRTVETLHWVPIPNRHDGENYKLIMASENGSEIFAAWVLVIQVASKCQPRGTLLRGNGAPHTAATLSLKTSAPEIWFKRCLEFLEKHTDWLDVVQVADGCQSPVSQPPVKRRPSDEEGKEGMEVNGTEVKEPKTASPWIVDFDLELPESLRTQNCLEAVKLWLKHKGEKRDAYKLTGLKTSLTKWGNEFTAAEFPSAVENAIAAGWKGIYKENKPFNLTKIRRPVSETLQDISTAGIEKI